MMDKTDKVDYRIIQDDHVLGNMTCGQVRLGQVRLGQDRIEPGDTGSVGLSYPEAPSKTTQQPPLCGAIEISWWTGLMDALFNTTQQPLLCGAIEISMWVGLMDASFQWHRINWGVKQSRSTTP